MSDVEQEFIDRFYWTNGPCRADCGRMADELRASDARIAELEATVARLTAPPTPDEVVAFTHDRLFTTAGGGGNMGALTAFLERRMKG